jgi:hypothetical protein
MAILCGYPEALVVRHIYWRAVAVERKYSCMLYKYCRNRGRGV